MRPAEAMGRNPVAVRRCAAVRFDGPRCRRQPRASLYANVAAERIFSLVMPIAAPLMIGDSVLGAEVRAGTFHFTWLSPTATWQIVLGRWLGGSIVALLAIAPASALAAVIAGAPSSAWPAFVASAVGSITYVALFITVGCITRRTAVWSLAIVFLVERLLGAALTGIAQLSPTWESRPSSSASSTTHRTAWCATGSRRAATP